MKILVFGIPGSGKTVLCNRLGSAMRIPVFHIDRHFFEKGWQERPQKNFLDDVQVELAKEHWIIDGNAMRTLELRYKQADHAVYCRLPKWKCLFRVLYRWLSNLGKPKQDGPDDTTNSIRWKLLVYLWRFPSRYGQRIAELRRLYPHVQHHCIRSDKDAEELFHILVNCFKSMNSGRM